MKNIDSRYWVELSIITLLLVVLGWAAFTLLFPGNFALAMPLVLTTLVIMTVAGQAWLTGLMDKQFSKFNTSFMIYKALKMLVLMIFVIVSSLLDRDHAVPFILSTLVMYLAFMVFESRSLNRYSRKQAKR